MPTAPAPFTVPSPMLTYNLHDANLDPDVVTDHWPFTIATRLGTVSRASAHLGPDDRVVLHLTGRRERRDGTIGNRDATVVVDLTSTRQPAWLTALAADATRRLTVPAGPVVGHVRFTRGGYACTVHGPIHDASGNEAPYADTCDVCGARA